MTKLRLTPYIDSNAALGVFIVTKGGEKYLATAAPMKVSVASIMEVSRAATAWVVMVNPMMAAY